MLLDMSAQFALQNRVEKGAQLAFFAFGKKFHAAIPQIAHRTGDVEACGDLPHGITKANSLDVALVKDLHGCGHAPED